MITTVVRIFNKLDQIINPATEEKQDDVISNQDTLITEAQTAKIIDTDNGTADNLSETVKLEKEYIELLQGEGVTVHEVDAEAFAKAVAPVFEKFEKWTPGIYDRITEELAKIKK